MTEGAASSSTMVHLPPDEDPIFGFRVSKWIEHSDFAPIPPETSDERYKRINEETQYTTTANPTS
jgi:hypothetical protein